MPTEVTPWRQLEQQLAEESCFDRLLEQEEAMEAKTFKSVLAGPQMSSTGRGNAQTRWLQRALNRVTRFGISENGVLSVQTRRALQKFQAERGLRPTGTLGPRTRAALIKLSGMPAPRPRAEDDGDGPEAEAEAPSGRCPVDSPYVIRGFNQYSDDVRLLPPSQQNKLAALGAEIASSKSGAPGVAPVAQVIVVGHADLDAARERREPGFLQYMSEKRAAAVVLDLACHTGAVNLIPSGRGARALAVPAPRTELERACNRRVEVVLVRPSESLPHLDPNQSAGADFREATFRDFYHIALQATSGQYPPPVAEQKATEIAEKVVPFVLLRLQESVRCSPPSPWEASLLPYFKDALQGTAQKYPTADEVISKAYEIAKHSFLVERQTARRREWQSATLPQPMAPDCEIVRGKVPGPANHALCGTHGHILDTAARTVIAHDLDEYKKQPRR
jgi:outer membrane protein OmpA-like peptidoglycan-associated protein